ncbi:MAG: VWA domain-containing protein [Candidatus Cloacimonetes bacterium]|nr:VWA domain-containing protein [Candidatus Cloacimonadota bacterium]MDY0367149.1 VWA domain-containing protein [Candidatus Syntrophosphaera sp.]
MNVFFPRHLWLLLVLIPLVLLVVLLERRRRKRFARFAETSFYTEYLRNHSPFFQALKAALAILALVFIVLALLRPQWDYETRDFDSSGLDIMICLDISKSMDATDITPSRLQRAKLQISAFIDRLKGDRVGLISFAGVATMECPLTDDYESVLLMLGGLSTNSAARPGTDIGEALALAEKGFLGAGGSNVLLLITDGEDLGQEALTRAKRLSAQGVKIYTMGVGKEEGTLVRNTTTGEQILSKLDARKLREIAATGKGGYFTITPRQGELDSILQDIYNAEKGWDRSRNLTTLKDQYSIPAAAALLLLLAESFILPLRRTRKRK